MISNAIQAYNGKPEQKIDLIAWKNENNNIVISVKDYGKPKNIFSSLLLF